MIAAPAFVSTRYSLVGEPIALVKTWTGKEFGRVPGRQAGNDAGRKIGTAMTEDKPPFPPFTRETATQKVRAGEDGWNGRDPVKVASAYTVDSWWRNRSEFVEGRDAIIAFLTRKWQHELEYRLIKEMWAFEGNRIAVRFAYEYHDPPVRLTTRA